ncbi:MAG: methyl-accepting chemotaxis protein, partial [Planctomycetota bacterium]
RDAFAVARREAELEATNEAMRELARQIEKSSVTVLSTATEIASSSEEQERTAVETSASITEAVTAVSQISSTTQELARTMDEVHKVATTTALMATRGKENLEGMERTVRQLTASTESIRSQLSVIHERAEKINLAVTTITKVADQTNLLSVNAAIEAEKAGDEGRGFLVVAREVRRLADQTAQATDDIDQIVGEMQSSVTSGVMEMDKFSNQVGSAATGITDLSRQIANIVEDVEGLTSRFEDVGEGMQLQSESAARIREMMQRLSDGSQQTTEAVAEFRRASGDLRAAVGGLRTEIARIAESADSTTTS